MALGAAGCRDLFSPHVCPHSGASQQELYRFKKCRSVRDQTQEMENGAGMHAKLKWVL